MKLGIIADTHNLLDPRVERAFADVSHIVHAGDVCRPELIARLARVAPVTVVAGNNDTHPGWNSTETLQWAGFRFLVEHIVNPHRPAPDLRVRLDRLRPDVVVFGHSHRPFCERIDNILFLNPGSAGAPRFGLPRTVWLLHLEDGGLRPESITLGAVTDEPASIPGSQT